MVLDPGDELVHPGVDPGELFATAADACGHDSYLHQLVGVQEDQATATVTLENEDN